MGISFFRPTGIFTPWHRIVIRFHSPAAFTAGFNGTEWPKTAPHFHVGATLAHFGAGSSSTWISTVFGAQSSMLVLYTNTPLLADGSNLNSRSL